MISASGYTKPTIWAPSPGLVAPEDRSLWRSLEGAYPLWEGSGPLANDVSGNRRHGTINTPSTWNDREGLDIGAGSQEYKRHDAPWLNFDEDASHYIDLPAALLDGLAQSTVMIRLYYESQKGDAILSGANSGNDQDYLLLWDTTTVLRVYDGTGTTSFWQFPVGDIRGEHRTLTVTRDSTADDITCWLDDQEITASDTTASVDAISVDAGGLIFGQEQDSVGGGFAAGQALNGVVLGFYVWSRILNPTEIRRTALDFWGPLRPWYPAFSALFVPAAGDTISPTGISSTEAFGSSQLNSTVTATPADTGETFGSGSVNAALDPTGISSTEAFGAPTVDGQITPSSIASAEAFGAAALTADGVITPGGIVSSEAFGSASLGTILSLTGIASSENVPSPLIEAVILATPAHLAETFGNADLIGFVLPSGISSAEIVNSPTLQQILSPTGIASLEALGSLQLATTIFPSAAHTGESFGSVTFVVALVASVTLTVPHDVRRVVVPHQRRVLTVPDDVRTSIVEAP